VCRGTPQSQTSMCVLRAHAQSCPVRNDDLATIRPLNGVVQMQLRMQGYPARTATFPHSPHGGTMERDGGSGDDRTAAL
jgi:hypothetical protein